VITPIGLPEDELEPLSIICLLFLNVSFTVLGEVENPENVC
jgi:hypothetical protein